LYVHKTVQALFATKTLCSTKHKEMQAVTITQITPPELEALIENSIKKFFPVQPQSKPIETKNWFNLTELCDYLPDKPAKATVYGWVHANLIPCHKGQKKLRFQKSEIDNWLKAGRKKTLTEIDAETDAFLSNNKKNQWIKKWGKSIIDVTIQLIKLIIALQC
jgi:Helix-turn-helix domain